MIDSTNPRIIADNIRALRDEAGTQGDAIEALGSYSTTEVNTGKVWIDESPIYRKVVSFELPNATSKTVAHNIENLGTVVDFRCYNEYNEDSTYAVKQLGITGSGITLLQIGKTAITITSNSDLSALSAFAIVEYTKSATPTSDLNPAPDDTRSIEAEEREEEPIIDEPIEEPVVEVKKTTRKKTTTE